MLSNVNIPKVSENTAYALYNANSLECVGILSRKKVHLYSTAVSHHVYLFSFGLR